MPAPGGEPTSEVRGVLQVMPEGHGFLRSAANDFNAESGDPWVPREIVQTMGLEPGVELDGFAVPSPRSGFPQGVARVTTINGVSLPTYT